MQPHARIRTVGLCLVALAVAGCHTMRFQFDDTAHGRVVHERKPYFLWGLAPTRHVDLSEKCPTGIAAVREQTTFGDGLIGLVTLGLCETRTSWYYCRPAEDGGAR